MAGLGGASLAAVLAATPAVFSAVTVRAHEFAKLAFAVPLALLAVACLLPLVGWREIVGRTEPRRVAVMALLGFVLLASITAWTAESREIAFLGRLYRLEGAAAWCGHLAIFIAALAWIVRSGTGLALAELTLVASLVPSVYAIQQWLGYDFYSTPGMDARIIGTMGNPVILGGYLAVMAPPTLARAVVSSTHRVRMSWAVLLCLQLLALWGTQTRAALVAAVIGMGLVLTIAAVRVRAHARLAALGLGVAAMAGAVLAINLVPSLRTNAQQVPFVDRMVFDLSQSASDGSRAASRSVVSRLGTWQAGLDAFAAAPLPRQLAGYGPESAQARYYAHMPASVIAAEGYQSLQNFDRLHAEVLDMVLNHGLLGWLAQLVFFCAVVLAGMQAAFGVAAAGGWLRLAVIVGAGGLGGAGLAVAAGLGSAVPAAIGVGIGVGLSAAVAAGAWRAAQATPPVQCHEPSAASSPVMLVGLLGGMLAFWFGAQLSFQLIDARLVLLVFAAVILAEREAASLSAPDGEARRVGLTSAGLVEWGALFLMIGFLASMLPPVALEEGEQARTMLLRMASLLVAALLGWWLVSTVPGVDSSRWRSRIAALSLTGTCWLILQHAGRPEVASEFGLAEVHRVAAVRAGFVVFVAVVAAFAAYRVARGAPVKKTEGTGLAVLVPLVAGVGVAFGAIGWRAMVGDVATGSLQFVAADDSRGRLRLARIALEHAPWEWRHHQDVIYEHLAGALGMLSPNGIAPVAAQGFLRNLDAAEAAARRAVHELPEDPWARIALARAVQVRGLRVVRPLLPSSGAFAADEAEGLFDAAARMFPNFPPVWQGWAQLKFDAGAHADAFKMLDRMQAIIPGEPEAYVERLQMASKVGDVDAIERTLQMARRNLGAASLATVENVAKMQHVGGANRQR